jgi:hypothetical protein
LAKCTEINNQGMVVRVGKVLSLMLTRRAGKDGKWVDGWLRKREAPDLDSTQQTRPATAELCQSSPSGENARSWILQYWQCVAHNLQMIMDGQGRDSVRRTVNYHHWAKRWGRDEFAPGFPMWTLAGPLPSPGSLSFSTG